MLVGKLWEIKGETESHSSKLYLPPPLKTQNKKFQSQTAQRNILGTKRAVVHFDSLPCLANELCSAVQCVFASNAYITSFITNVVGVFFLPRTSMSLQDEI